MHERYAPSDCYFDKNSTLKNSEKLNAAYSCNWDGIRKFWTSAVAGAGFAFCLSITPASAKIDSSGSLELSGELDASVAPSASWVTSVQEHEKAWLKTLEAIRTNLPPEITPPMVFSNVTAALRAATDPNEIMVFDDRRVPRWLVETILHAAEVTDTDPVYLMALADKESGFTWTVRAKTSTASGLFQFLNGTWLEMIRDFGPSHNLLAEANAIENKNGKLFIRDPKESRRILELRNNPYVASLMAAEMLKRDRAKIEKRIGRELMRSEFYLAHFLGVGSAARLMRISAESPASAAAKLFPQAARANRTLFMKREGRKARSLSAVEFQQRVGMMMDQRFTRYERVSQYVDDK